MKRALSTFANATADRRAASQLAVDVSGFKPRAALVHAWQDSLALGYYRSPRWGFNLAAAPEGI